MSTMDFWVETFSGKISRKCLHAAEKGQDPIPLFGSYLQEPNWRFFPKPKVWGCRFKSNRGKTKTETLKDPPFQMGGSKLIAGLLESSLLKSDSVSYKTLDMRIRTLFGVGASADLFTQEFRGRPFPVLFKKQYYLAVWDVIYEGKQYLLKNSGETEKPWRAQSARPRGMSAAGPGHANSLRVAKGGDVQQGACPPLLRSYGKQPIFAYLMLISVPDKPETLAMKMLVANWRQFFPDRFFSAFLPFPARIQTKKIFGRFPKGFNRLRAEIEAFHGEWNVVPGKVNRNALPAKPLEWNDSGNLDSLPKMTGVEERLAWEKLEKTRVPSVLGRFRFGSLQINSIKKFRSGKWWGRVAPLSPGAGYVGLLLSSNPGLQGPDFQKWAKWAGICWIFFWFGWGFLRMGSFARFSFGLSGELFLWFFGLMTIPILLGLGASYQYVRDLRGEMMEKVRRDLENRMREIENGFLSARSRRIKEKIVSQEWFGMALRKLQLLEMLEKDPFHQGVKEELTRIRDDRRLLGRQPEAWIEKALHKIQLETALRDDPANSRLRKELDKIRLNMPDLQEILERTWNSVSSQGCTLDSLIITGHGGFEAKKFRAGLSISKKNLMSIVASGICEKYLRSREKSLSEKFPSQKSGGVFKEFYAKFLARNDGENEEKSNSLEDYGGQVGSGEELSVKSDTALWLENRAWFAATLIWNVKEEVREYLGEIRTSKKAGEEDLWIWEKSGARFFSMGKEDDSDPIDKQFLPLLERAGQKPEIDEDKVSKTLFWVKAGANFPSFLIGWAIPLNKISDRITSEWHLNVASMVMFVLFVVACGILLSRWLILPIRKMVETLQGIGRGNLNLKMGFQRKDELGDASLTIDKMADWLREKDKISRFVSDQVVETVAAGQNERLFQGRQQEVTMLVSDIRSFTTHSEKHLPEEMFFLLNAHFSEMTLAIQKNGGKVDRFIGDAIQAFFISSSEESSALKALKAAREMMLSLKNLMLKREQLGLFSYEIGIGLAKGKMVTGVLGDPNIRLDFTLMGETLKRAHELEGASRNGKATRIMCDQAIALEGKKIATFEELGNAEWLEVQELHSPEPGSLSGARTSDRSIADSAIPEDSKGDEELPEVASVHQTSSKGSNPPCVETRSIASLHEAGHFINQNLPYLESHEQDKSILKPENLWGKAFLVLIALLPIFVLAFHGRRVLEIRQNTFRSQVEKKLESSLATLGNQFSWEGSLSLLTYEVLDDIRQEIISSSNVREDVSSQKLAENAEGGKRPSAGDEGRELREDLPQIVKRNMEKLRTSIPELDWGLVEVFKKSGGLEYSSRVHKNGIPVLSKHGVINLLFSGLLQYFDIENNLRFSEVEMRKGAPFIYLDGKNLERSYERTYRGWHALPRSATQTRFIWEPLFRQPLKPHDGKRVRMDELLGTIFLLLPPKGITRTRALQCHIAYLARKGVFAAFSTPKAQGDWNIFHPDLKNEGLLPVNKASFSSKTAAKRWARADGDLPDGSNVVLYGRVPDPFGFISSKEKILIALILIFWVIVTITWFLQISGQIQFPISVTQMLVGSFVIIMAPLTFFSGIFSEQSAFGRLSRLETEVEEDLYERVQRIEEKKPLYEGAFIDGLERMTSGFMKRYAPILIDNPHEMKNWLNEKLLDLVASGAENGLYPKKLLVMIDEDLTIAQPAGFTSKREKLIESIFHDIFAYSLATFNTNNKKKSRIQYFVGAARPTQASRRDKNSENYVGFSKKRYNSSKAKKKKGNSDFLSGLRFEEVRDTLLLMTGVGATAALLSSPHVDNRFDMGAMSFRNWRKFWKIQGNWFISHAFWPNRSIDWQILNDSEESVTSQVKMHFWKTRGFRIGFPYWYPFHLTKLRQLDWQEVRLFSEPRSRQIVEQAYGIKGTQVNRFTDRGEEKIQLAMAGKNLVQFTFVTEESLGKIQEAVRASLTTRRIFFFLFLLVILFLAQKVSRTILTPILEFTHRAKRFMMGDFGVRLDEEHGNELGQLAVAFNQLAKGVEDGRVLRRFVSDSVRRAAVDDVQEGRGKKGEKKTAVILFAGMSSFAGHLRTWEPSKLIEELNDYLKRMSTEIEAPGGEIDKFIGEKILAVFHSDRLGGDDKAVLGAFTAARQMQLEFAKENRFDGSHLGIGIVQGEVLAGIMGSPEVRLEYTVIGDTVNLASRLCDIGLQNPKDSIVLEGNLAAKGNLIRKIFGPAEINRLPISSVKGKSREVQVYSIGNFETVAK